MAGSGIIGTLLLSIVTQANVSGLTRTDRAIMRTTKQVQRLRRETGLIGRFGKGLAGMLGIGYGVMGIKNAITGYVEFEKQLGAIHSRFFAIEKDNARAEKQFNFARKVAKDTAMDIKDVADSYSIFYSSASRALGESGSQEVYKNWTEVSRVLHLSGAQYERVMYALREMSSKGQLYAQDLMIQMGTHVPDIRDIAETSIRNLGIKDVQSIKDFQEFTKKGSPESKEAMARFLVEMSRESKKRYASDEALKKALQQPDALIQNIKNVGFEFMNKFSEAGGSYMVIKILQGLSDYVTSLDLDGITNTLGQIAHGVGNIARHLPEILDALKRIAMTYLMFKGFGLLGSGIGKVVGFFKNIAVLRNWMKLGKGNMVWAYLIKKLGIARGGVLAGMVAKMGLKLGAKAFFASAINVIPVIGQIASVVMWIWTAINILSIWLKPYLTEKKDKDLIKKFGTEAEVRSALEIAKKYKEDPNKMAQEFDKAGISKELRSAMYIDDHGVVNFNINGSMWDEAKLVDMIKTLQTNQKNKKPVNNPKIVQPKELTWRDM